MLYGFGVITIIAIMGGAIAYIGDKLGTRVGKRRMSLFGLRPKHTSIIVTIVTGILIAALTLGILAILSENVRTALFGMEQLQAQMDSLTQDIETKNKQLEKGRKELADKNKELEVVNADIQATQAELEEARAARESMSGELINVQEAYKEAEAKLASSNSEVASLAETKKNLEGHISELQVTMKRLGDNITHVREGNVLFRVGEVLSGALVRPGLTLSESQHVVLGIVNDTNGLILKRLNETEGKTALYVTRENLESAAKQIAEAKEPVTIRVVAAANIIYGEPALAEIHVYPYKLVYRQNEVIWSDTVAGGKNAQYSVLGFLRSVNKEAKAHGIFPDPLTGDIGSLPGDELFATIREVENMHGTVQLEAVAKTDIYTDGPVQIQIRIK